MGKRGLRKRVDSLLRRIEEHRLKIEIERSKESGDHGLIRHWQAEIDSFEVSVARAKKRLRS